MLAKAEAEVIARVVDCRQGGDVAVPVWLVVTMNSGYLSMIEVQLHGQQRLADCQPFFLRLDQLLLQQVRTCYL